MDDEARLIALAQAGDAEAFGYLYDRHVDTVYGFAHVLTGDLRLTRRITAETFLRALREIDTFVPLGPGGFRTWLVSLARDLLPGNDGSCPRQPSRRVRSETDEILEQLRSIAPDQRECLALRFVLNWPLDETAAAMNRSVRAVTKLQYRAARALVRRISS